MDLINEIKNGRDFEKKSEAYERARKLMKYNSKILFNSYHSLKSHLIYIGHPVLSLYLFVLDYLRSFYTVFLFGCSMLMFKLEQANDRFVDYLINMGATAMELAAAGFAVLSLVTRSLVSLGHIKYAHSKEYDIAFHTKDGVFAVAHEKALSKSFIKRYMSTIEEIGSDFSQELKHHHRAFSFV